jgi:glycosyltransferase involved in cell wall biosynthesis
MTLVTVSPRNKFRFSEREIDGVRIIESPSLLPMPARNGLDPYDVLRRILKLRSFHFDIVHAFDCRPSVIYPALFIKKTRSALLFTDWADWWARGGAAGDRRGLILISKMLSPVETHFEEFYRRSAHGQTTINDVLRERAIGLGVNPERVITIPSGADTDNIKPLKKSACRKRLGIDSGRPVAGFVGYAPYDMKYMLDAFGHLVRRIPEALLILAGEFPFYINSFIKNLHFKRNLVVTGPLPYNELQYVLGASDVLLLPYLNRLTNRGRWPNKIGDYLSAGRPVVTNPTGDFARVFKNLNFIRMAGESSHEFADAIEEILLGKEDKEELGIAARAFAEKEMDWKVMTDRLFAFYRLSC